MTKLRRQWVQTLYLVSAPLLLLVALVLNRWWAWIPLLLFVSWLFRRCVVDEQTDSGRGRAKRKANSEDERQQSDVIMPQIPAICEDCQAIFRSGANIAAKNATFEGCAAGPCPRCGGWGRTLDGVYSALGNVLHLLLQQPSPDVLKQIVPLLSEGVKRHLPRDEIVANIEQTTPELRAIGDSLPTTRSELYAFIAILVAVLGMLLADWRDKPEDRTEATPQVINQYIDNSIELIYHKDTTD